MSQERTGGPGPRKEVGDAESSRRDPPHVTENDRGAPVQESMSSPHDVPSSPANAHGSDEQDPDASRIDPESAYDHRPGEDKDRRETDMP